MMRRLLRLRVSLCCVVAVSTLPAAKAAGTTQPLDLELLATDLSNGVPVANLSAAQGDWLHFVIAVPDNAAGLEMQISGNSGDADLYTKYGSEPTTSSYDCRPYDSDSNETCSVASPAAGNYFVGVRAYRAFSGLTVVARYDVEGAVVELSKGVPVTSLSGAAETWRRYRIKVSENAVDLEIKLSGGSGDADLYVKSGSQPSSSSYDCRPYLSGNNETCSAGSPTAGDYYVSIHAYTAYSGASLVADYDTGQPGSKTFIITSVNDNLDNSDMDILASGLQSLGYRKVVSNANVSSSQMISYLQNNVTTYYHTGHGTDGRVMTSDGSINHASTTVNVENTIFATCLTLTETGWKNAFGASAKTIMGYTKVSYDGIDEDVVETLVEEVGDAQTYQGAWYLANVGISSLRDRWAAYVREGSAIVEYSARTGNTPTTYAVQWEPLGTSGRLWIQSGLLETTLTSSTAWSASVSVAPEPRAAYLEPGAFQLLAPNGQSEGQALEMAENWLRQEGELPQDAVLDDIIAVERRADVSSSPETVAHVVVYKRDVRGRSVRGNRIADHIAVLVGADGVVSVSRYWPETAMGQSLLRSSTLLQAKEAVRLAADDIAAILKQGELAFTQIEPVYGTTGPATESRELVPAYELLSTDGLRFVVDAQTGQLLF